MVLGGSNVFIQKEMAAVTTISNNRNVKIFETTYSLGGKYHGLLRSFPGLMIFSSRSLLSKYCHMEINTLHVSIPILTQVSTSNNQAKKGRNVRASLF